jgi:hypothetical protein
VLKMAGVAVQAIYFEAEQVTCELTPISNELNLDFQTSTPLSTP